MSVKMHLKAEDSQGNKAEIEFTEFKTVKDAIGVMLKMQKEIEQLKKEIEKLKNGTSI